MSITMGEWARNGPWPISWGSTAWSPPAQMVRTGIPPSFRIVVSTTPRRSSEVNFDPPRRSQPSRPIIVDLRASIPARRPASAARSEVSIFFTSSRVLISRSGQKGSFATRSLMFKPSSFRARPRGNDPGTSALLAPSRFRHAAITCSVFGGGAPRPARFAIRVHDQTSVAFDSRFARSISRSLITRIVRDPVIRQRNGSGAKKPVG